MKKFKFVVFLVLLFFTFTICASAADIRVYVNNSRVNEDVIVKDERTYVPLRAVSEALGAQVMWDQATSSVQISFTEDDAVARVVANVSPSVVTIVGNYASATGQDQYNNPTMHGTGVIYKSNGYIVTNAHVVEDIKNLTVVLNDGTTLPGKVLIGTPISLSMRNTVTKGIISGTEVAMNDSYYKLIQTDASINPGNSGGPLVNINGELIGINSSKYMSVAIDNVSFAIPVDTVQYAINQFETNGKILRPNMDFVLDQSWEAKIGLPTTKGLTVKSSNNSNFAPGDVVTSVNGIDVHSISDWNEALKRTYNGQYYVVNYTPKGGAPASVTLYQ